MRARARARPAPGPDLEPGHPALARLRALCAALPGSVCEARGDHAGFRVRGRVYAYFLADHHGDGIVSVCVKSAPGEHVERVARDPGRCYLPAHIGARGWYALRLDRGRIDWREVADIVTTSYRLVAPRRLAATLTGEGAPAGGAARRARTRA